jgi:hypothetical protein
MFGRKARIPETKVPETRFRMPELHLPEVRVPEVHLRDVKLPDVKLPDVKIPELHLPEVKIPQVSLPSRVDIPEFHVPSVHLAGFRTPDLHTPELELRLRDGLRVRRKRSNPIWLAFKFVLGAGLGLGVGCLIAALLAPSAGEDTRNKLRGMLPTGGGAEPAPSDGEAIRPLRGPDEPAAGGIKGRFQRALDEAKKQRELKERELTAEFATAKRTGTAPL